MYINILRSSPTWNKVNNNKANKQKVSLLPWKLLPVFFFSTAKLLEKATCTHYFFTSCSFLNPPSFFNLTPHLWKLLQLPRCQIWKLLIFILLHFSTTVGIIVHVLISETLPSFVFKKNHTLFTCHSSWVLFANYIQNVDVPQVPS